MKRTAGILIAWAGYAVGTWGWVLWKRYNISFVQWINPVTPYVWPEGGTVPSIPDDRVFPGKGGGEPSTAAGGKPGKSPEPGKPPVDGHCPPGYHAVGGVCVPIK